MKILAVFVLLAGLLEASPVQIPLQEYEPQAGSANVPTVAKKRELQGRFLHITDFHPDRFYNVYTSTADDYACHRGQGPAGIYGAETSDCDSPVSLINKTMEWVGKELKDKIDFVVWTGDSARHDNDEKLPRSDEQVVGLNKLMVEKMFETFGKHNGDEDDDDPNNDFEIPIIPNLGNNDILPHNIFRTGPNKWTRTYAKLWRQFIPEAQRHQFEQGGWFFVEVIPNKLAVVSFNSLYFFKSNAAADGCAAHSEPGYEQLEWLRIQLQFMRERGMKAILTGHVPPAREDTKTNWDETCWQKYTLWLRQYRDVIITSLYGHFNYDHFILQDFEDLRKGTKKGKMPNYEIQSQGDDGLHTAVSPNYFVDLRNSWSGLPRPPKSLSWLKRLQSGMDELQYRASLPSMKSFLAQTSNSDRKKRKQEEAEYLKKMGGEFGERFAASFVAASVVPNLFPSLRVYEYNITGLDKRLGYSHDMQSRSAEDFKRTELVRRTDVDTLKKKKKAKKYKFTVPEGPSKSSPPGPAYSPQSLSLIRYTQYLANLTHINNDFHGLSKTDGLNAEKWKEGKHKGKTKPKDHEPNPKKFKYEVHYDTKHDDVYRLEDLTMPSLVKLARRIGDFESADVMSDGHEVDVAKKHKKHKKKRHHKNEAWITFVRRAFVETLSDEEIEEQFG